MMAYGPEGMQVGCLGPMISGPKGPMIWDSGFVQEDLDPRIFEPQDFGA